MLSPPASAAGTASGPSIHEVVRGSLVETVFQPLADLGSGIVVGYEALSRGPQGSELESPEALFDAARLAGLSGALDWICLAGALRAALAANVHPSCAIFINVEPSSLRRPPPAWLTELIEIAQSKLTVVFEITERAIADAPAELLGATARIRGEGMLIAVDDVGAHPGSLALLPFLGPELVKLDIDVTQTAGLWAMARTATAVHAYAEWSGACVVAEGIETSEHRESALALGADLGQGWLFGRPGALPADVVLPATRRLTAARRPEPGRLQTPFDLLSARRPILRGDKGLLLRMSQGIEEQARTEGDSVVLLSAFQDSRFFGPRVRRRYRRLGEHCALVGALGVGLATTPEPGVRGASLALTDPLCGEWAVCLVGPYITAAFAGKDLGDSGPDDERRFDFVISHDRDLVIAATHSMMTRLAVD